MSEISDIDLLKALGVELEVEKPKQYSPLEARLIAGFEDILKFVEEHGRLPQHGEDNDIFERLYAVRLDQLRKNEQACSLLADIDAAGLLAKSVDTLDPDVDDETLLAELGASVEPADDDITKLRNVSPVKYRQAAEEVANRKVCRDFETFEPLFEQVRKDLELGVRISVGDTTQNDFDVGRFFILRGQLAYVAEKGDDFKATGKNVFDARLRVIFDNGTESGLLMRSLQRSFNEPKNNARAISTLDSGPLFGEVDPDENETGTIYVLRSLSSLPEIAPYREAILKIGVTSGDVKRRISNAKNDSTYLLGDVEIVDEYTLYNINRVKLERLLQRIFSTARLAITIKDRFGNPVQPNEWFMIPAEAVAEAVQLIKSGEVNQYRYDAQTAQFVKVEK